MIAAVPLTARSSQAMDLVAAGLSNDEIGVRMGISSARVRQLLAAAYDYYDAPNRTAAARAHERARLLDEVYRTVEASRRPRPKPRRVTAGQQDLELA